MILIDQQYKKINDIFPSNIPSKNICIEYCNKKYHIINDKFYAIFPNNISSILNKYNISEVWYGLGSVHRIVIYKHLIIDTNNSFENTTLKCYGYNRDHYINEWVIIPSNDKKLISSLKILI